MEREWREEVGRGSGVREGREKGKEGGEEGEEEKKREENGGGAGKGSEWKEDRSCPIFILLEIEQSWQSGNKNVNGENDSRINNKKNDKSEELRERRRETDLNKEKKHTHSLCMLQKEK